MLIKSQALEAYCAVAELCKTIRDAPSGRRAAAKAASALQHERIKTDDWEIVWSACFPVSKVVMVSRW